MNKYTAVILGGGVGSRTGLEYNKVFLEINGKPVIQYSIELFEQDPKCGKIVLVINKNDESHIIKYGFNKYEIVYGGATRQESVEHALPYVKTPYTLVHDGARPFLKLEDVHKLLEQTIHYKAVCLGVKVTDTIKEVNELNEVVKSLQREKLMAIQTPQLIETELFKKVHLQAIERKFLGTDDVSLVEHFTKEAVKIVIGDYSNIKITTKEDIEFLSVFKGGNL